MREIKLTLTLPDDIKAGELWAIALSQNGQYLAGTTADGRVNVWDTQALTTDGGNAVKTQEYQSKGSFGSSVDLVCPDRIGANSTDIAVFRRRDDRIRTPERVGSRVQQQYRPARAFTARPDRAGPQRGLLAWLHISGRGG